MIEINDLHKQFGKLKVLNGVNLNLEKGSCVSLLGPNASGKTTLLKIILGIVRPSQGTVTLNGINALKDFRCRDFIGYMPQIGRYPDTMRVGQVVDLLKSLRKPMDGYDDELIEAYGLNQIYHKSIGSLSGGTRQKVSACLAFLFRSQILILDEPTAGLDPLSSEILKEKIQKEAGEDRLIIVTSHILSDLQDVSSHVVYLNEGEVVLFETLQQLLERTNERTLPKAVAAIMKNLIYA